MNDPHGLAELEMLVAELARLEEQYPHNSQARTAGMDGYICAQRARADTLRKKHHRREDGEVRQRDRG